MERPPVRPARGEHACVLARAVVSEPPVGTTLLRAVLEIVDRGARPREHLAHGRELRRLGVMGGARDRELVVLEMS